MPRYMLIIIAYISILYMLVCLYIVSSIHIPCRKRRALARLTSLSSVRPSAVSTKPTRMVGIVTNKHAGWGPKKIATLRYNKWLNYGLWMFMVDYSLQCSCGL